MGHVRELNALGELVANLERSHCGQLKLEESVGCGLLEDGALMAEER